MLPFSVAVDEGWNGKCSRVCFLSQLSCMAGEATHVAGAP